MARALRRPRRDDLLARRARLGVHSLAPATLFVLGSRRNDRRRVAPRHRNGDRAAVRGQPWPERGGVRLLPTARLSAVAAVEGDIGAKALSAGSQERRLSAFDLHPDAGDRPACSISTWSGGSISIRQRRLDSLRNTHFVQSVRG